VGVLLNINSIVFTCPISSFGQSATKKMADRQELLVPLLVLASGVPYTKHANNIQWGLNLCLSIRVLTADRIHIKLGIEDIVEGTSCLVTSPVCSTRSLFGSHRYVGSITHTKPLVMT
jgi:hypothetical protein